MSAHQIISLDLAEDSYNIHVAYDLRQQLADLIADLNKGQKWVLLSQQPILEHYQDVVAGLIKQGFNIDVITVPENESAKNIRHAEEAWTQMVDMGCDRSSVLIALGGGVVGDLGGFVAATYMRGIPFVQVPTTLLAMIDSAIGGKTAINLTAGKNLVGAIYQPKMVIVDPGFLATLPTRNVISSLAEAIKYGFIRDKSIFDIIDDNFDEMVQLQNPQLLTEIISKSCKIKSQIVSNDQFENGERKLLNYGHTIGHAFETIQDYGGLYHGEAVLYGMKCANHISWQKGLLNENDYRRAQAVLNKFPLPELGNVLPDKVLEIVAHDKKNINGKLSFILLDAIGNGVINTEVTQDDIVNSLTVVS